MRVISPPGSAIPGIAPAMLVEGPLLFLSGHTPLDASGAVVSGTLEAQLDQCFRNISETLAAAEATFDKVARLTIYVRDYAPAQLAAIRAVRDRWVNPEAPPASALIGVAALFHPDVLVEVDAIAALG